MPRGRPKKVPIQYDHAESVEKIAKDLIRNYHSYLATQSIAYLFKNREMFSKGRCVLATAEKTSAKVKALSEPAGYDFVIIVSYPTWLNLTSKQRSAVVDHELTHCFVEENDDTGEATTKILPHDVDEFEEIIRRHGLYKKDLERLGRVIRKVKKKKIKLDLCFLYI